jgi:predicted metal-dependent peptidase
MAQKFSKLEKAKAQLVLSHPFFASILLRGKLVERKDIPTAAVDARGTIYYNEKFFESLELQEVVFVLAHECFHKMLQHFARLGGRNLQKANYAQDACINDILNTSGVGKQPEGCVHIPGSKDKTWEEVYASLPESPSNGKQYMEGDGIGEDIMPGGENMTQAEKSEIEAAMKVEMAQAAQAARTQGKMPAALQRFVDSVLYSPVPWYDVLRRYMDTMSVNDYSWSKPNRRYAGQGIYLPSMQSEPTMGHVVLVIDTSGSIGERELAQAEGHLNGIVESCRPTKTTVLYVDADVSAEDEYTPDELPLKFKNCSGGGGTDMRKAFQWVDDNGVEPAVIIVISDLYTPFPESVSHPTIWLSTTDQVAPDCAGTTIRFED